MLGIEITAQISCRERSWISLHVVMPLTMKGHIIHSRSMFKLCEERHTLSRPVDNLRSTGEMCQFYMMIINLSAMEQYTHSLLCLSYSCIQRILVVRPSQTVGHLCMRMSGGAALHIVFTSSTIDLCAFSMSVVILLDRIFAWNARRKFKPLTLILKGPLIGELKRRGREKAIAPGSS